jgi:hypothetical protein
MKIIIYATHSFGTFETLQQHPDIVVLGHGTKWQGFIEKSKVIRSYLKTLPDHEIVAIIDGFDSYILKTDGLQQEFLKMNCKVLVSTHKVQLTNIDVVDNYLIHKVFSSCKNNIVANSGLIMGYVNELKIVYSKIINGPTNDDQRNLNKACNELPFLKLDTNHIIFQNCLNMKEIEESNAYICQIPGTPSFSRLSRALFEYTPYFIPEILIMMLCIIFIFYIVYDKRNIIKRITKLKKRSTIILQKYT